MKPTDEQVDRVTWAMREASDRSGLELTYYSCEPLARAAIAAIAAMPEPWMPIESAPKDRLIDVRGDAGPYGIRSWTGRAKWGLPDNWHKDKSTWMTEDGAAMWLAGYYPVGWREISLPSPPQKDEHP